MTVGVTLDGGSQRSYATEKLRDAMNLPVSHSGSLKVKPFGSNTRSHQQCEVVNPYIEVKDSDDITLTAIYVPVISSLVQGQCPREAARVYPQSLTLAYNCEEKVKVDILVCGESCYW